MELARSSTPPDFNDMALLEVSGVSKYFAGLRAIDNIDLSVEEGQIVSIIGPNGAGKTTLFNCITGFTPSTAGVIKFRDRSIHGIPPDKITSMGIARTFQSIRLFGGMTALENVMVGGHSRSKAGLFATLFRIPFMLEEEKMLSVDSFALLSFVGLSGRQNTMAYNLSYGEQRRLEIARALAVKPEILLLDEPAAGMNPNETVLLVDLIGQIRSMGITVILIEHDMKLVMGISDRVIVLDHGEKIAEGRPEEIQKDKKVIEAYLGAGDFDLDDED